MVKTEQGYKSEDAEDEQSVQPPAEQSVQPEQAEQPVQTEQLPDLDDLSPEELNTLLESNKEEMVKLKEKYLAQMEKLKATKAKLKEAGKPLREELKKQKEKERRDTKKEQTRSEREQLRIIFIWVDGVKYIVEFRGKDRLGSIRQELVKKLGVKKGQKFVFRFGDRTIWRARFWMLPRGRL